MTTIGEGDDIRDFDPHTKLSMVEFTRELMRERGGKD
jgi:hypothetical protein